MKIRKKILLLIFTIIFINYTVEISSNSFYLCKEVQVLNTNLLDNQTLIASLPQYNIKLFATKPQHDGVYKGLKLYIDGKSAFFNWISDSNPSFKPKLYLNHLNYDMEKELIIILTTGSGSDVHVEEIHVINPDNFSETEVENPLDIIKNNVKTSITKKNGDVLIQVTLNNKTYEVKRKDSDAGFWFENVGFGSWMHYDIKNNLLTVRVGAQVSPSGFVGEVIINYKFLGDKYVLKEILFEKSQSLWVRLISIALLKNNIDNLSNFNGISLGSIIFYI